MVQGKGRHSAKENVCADIIKENHTLIPALVTSIGSNRLGLCLPRGSKNPKLHPLRIIPRITSTKTTLLAIPPTRCIASSGVTKFYISSAHIVFVGRSSAIAILSSTDADSYVPNTAHFALRWGAVI